LKDGEMGSMPPDENPGPQDPITELAAGAAQLHELFAAYVHAGFTRVEALQIVIALATAAIQPPQ
jgi:hypothetical protein